MYPVKRKKSDEERFLTAFAKKVGALPEEYVRRKLAGGMDEELLQKAYDQLAIEIAMKARCTALRYDAVKRRINGKPQERKIAAGPVCPRCGKRLVLRTGQSGPRKGQKYWGCEGYPDCRYTKNPEVKK